MKRPLLLLAGLIVVAVALYFWRGSSGSPGSARSAERGNTADKTGSNQAACRGEIRGRVVDGVGRPVAGAELRSNARTARSDASGQFRLGPLAAGRHRVEVTAEGYVVPGPPDQRALPVTLADGETGVGCVERLVLTVRQPGTVRGKVVAGDRPVAAQLGLFVLAADGLTGRLQPFALDGVGRSGADGMFTLQGVAPGRLRVVAETEDHAATESREIFLRDRESVGGIVIDLLPAGQLVGRVRDRQDRPIVGASVVASGGNLAHAQRNLSDSDGAFVLDALPTGTLQLRVSARGYRSERLDAVEVRSDGNPALDIVLEPASGLYGRVLEPDGQPARMAWVGMRAEKRGEARRVDPQGAFSWAEGPDQVQALAVSPYFESSESTALRAGEEGELRLRDGGQISGQVVDASGVPINSYRIGIGRFEVDGFAPYGLRVFEIQSVSRSDGQFEIGPLRPGRYVLQAVADGQAPAASEKLTVLGGQTTGGVVIRLRGGATVHGQVRGPEGNAISGARVALFDPASPFKPQQTLSDENGQYRLRGVAEGRRSMRVSAKGYLTQLASGVEVPASGEVWREVVLGRAKAGAGFSFHGIGAVLRRRGDGVEIMQTMPGHGAETYGLQAGDRIVAVDHEPIDGLGLDQVVERIRGEEGVAVELDIERPGEGLRTVEVERGEVVVESPHGPGGPHHGN